MPVRPENLEERLVWVALTCTWGFYLLGALYVVAPVIGWLLGLCFVGRNWRSWTGHQPANPVPVITWAWLAGMGLMLVALLIGHADFALGPGKIIKSAIGWAKGWALLALFMLAGMLPIRAALLTRAVSLLCIQTLIALPLFIAAWLIGLPQDLYVSPLQAVGGPGPDFFTVSLYGINPDTGQPRWRLFTPWGPALGFVATVCFFIVLREANPRLRWPALAGAVAMLLVSGSRLGLVSLPAVAAAGFVLSRLHLPLVHYAAGGLSLLAGLFAAPLIAAASHARLAFHAARPESSRVRAALGRIATDRWASEAPVFGHGIVERGSHLVEFMPIGSHHTWYGLLFVKGMVGVLALAVPMLWTAAVLLRRAQSSKDARTALCILLVIALYSFGENLEVLAYLYWPGLIAIGVALKDTPSRARARDSQCKLPGEPLCAPA